ncbi:MAG: response regulator [Candidatus Omnitrophota bacterium]
MEKEKIVLIVDDDETITDLLERTVTPMVEEKVICVSSGAEAKNIMEKKGLNLAILDYKLPDTDGIELLKFIKSVDANVPVVIITGFGSIETGVEAIRQGAYDYILKPFHPEKIHAMVRSLMAFRKLREENVSLRRELESKTPSMLSNSLHEHEKELILKVFAECGNDIKKASKELGISPLMLYVKIRKLGIDQ